MIKAFDLGQPMATPGALEAAAGAGVDVNELLKRHMACDWSELPPEDAALNDATVRSGGKSMILSQHTLEGVRFWVITEAGHGVTTILLPEEY